MSQALRVNLGCGKFSLPKADGWLNVDADPSVEPDLCLTVPPVPWADGSVAEVYCGHLIEHLAPDDAHQLLRECYRVLQPGGRLGVVVPDTFAIMAQYVMGSPLRVEGQHGQWWRLDDLDDVCAYFLFATDQATPHRWAYDETSLTRALSDAGFVEVRPFDRYTDPRLSTPQFYSLCLQAEKPDA